MSVALLFSPQGAQAVGMGRDLAAVWPSARAVFAEADAILGWPISTLAWEGPEEELNDTRQTQPALLTTSIASLRALDEAAGTRGEPLAPGYVAGHSVGEYAALVAAGALSFEDALRLVARRGALMADAGVAGGMAAVIGLDRDDVATAVASIDAGDDLVVANDNAPGQVVISGTDAALEAAAGPLRAAGARRVIRLKVSGPFHSPLMRGVADELERSLAEVTWHDADPPIVSNVTGTPLSAAADLRSSLARQVYSPVEWVASMERMLADGVDTFVECGPGGTLVGMVRRLDPDARTLSVVDPASCLEAAAVLDLAAAGISA